MQPRLMTRYVPPNGPLRVIHRDAEVLLVDKPSGLLSVPGKPAELADCLETRVKDAFPEALLIHRLDMETSGIMVFAMNRRAQRLINGQFEKRIVKKTYLARVAGLIGEDSGTIDLPLIADWPNRPMQKVCFENGKSAITHWQVVSRDDGTTLLELKPETGRSHQLRVHLKELGHPILGDPFYAAEEIYRAKPRLQLHASSLSLRHPDGGEWATWEASCQF